MQAPLPSLVCGLLLAAGGVAAAQDGAKYSDVRIVGHVLEPKKVPVTEERIVRLDLPDGFRIEVFAEDLVNPRMLAVAGDGTVYVTRRAVGDVLMLRDEDGDGRADTRRTVARRPLVHGIWIEGRKVYLATPNEVYLTDIGDDGGFGRLERIIDDLPEGGQHPNRTLAIGPDGMLYISVGSTCNACAETSPENATLLRAAPDGSQRRIFASGLRNTIGFGWQPDTGRLWGMDHGIDWLGDQEQVEELNLLEEGARYGWPYIYGDGQSNPQDEPPAGISFAEWAKMSRDPVLGYTPHAAPMQMAFYDGSAFPADYRGDAFVAMRGSWNRRPPAGFEVVRIDFEDGRPRSFEPFVTGFLTGDGEGGWEQFGRLAGLAVAPDGSLYFSDDSGGVIYRITYGGSEADPDQPAAAAPRASAEPPAAGEAGHGPEKLAIDLLQAERPSGLEVTSEVFAAGQPIPSRFAKAGEDISPPLSWSGAPEGTEAFAVLVEDPDVSGRPPFVHWIAVNIPPSRDDLPEALPGTPKLMLPEGVLQGSNSRGSTGWTGMHPPAGEGAHDYHFQVFALDRELDVEPGASRRVVLEAMEGRVLAAGQLIGTFRRPPAEAD